MTNNSPENNQQNEKNKTTNNADNNLQSNNILSPSNEINTASKKLSNDFFGGIGVGLLLMFLIGFGVCAGIMSSGSSISSSDRSAHETRLIADFKKIEADAKANVPDMVWKYSQIIRDENVRHALNNSLKQAQAKKLADELVQKSVSLNSFAGRKAHALQLLNQGMPDYHSEDAQLLNYQKLSAGLDESLRLIKDTCTSINQNDPYNHSETLQYPYVSRSIYDEEPLAFYPVRLGLGFSDIDKDVISNIASNVNAPQLSSLKQRLNMYILFNKLHCHDQDFLLRELGYLTVRAKIYKLASWHDDEQIIVTYAVMASLLDRENILPILFSYASDPEKAKKDYQQLLTSYQHYFGNAVPLDNYKQNNG